MRPCCPAKSASARESCCSSWPDCSGGPPASLGHSGGPVIVYVGGHRTKKLYTYIHTSSDNDFDRVNK